MSFRSKVTLAGLIVLSAACTTEAGTPLGPDTSAEPVLNANKGGSKSQSADVISIPDLPTVVELGSGSLTRTPHGITTHIHTDPGAIPAGDVVTLWGAIFNNPGECAIAFSCDFPDVGNPDVEGSLVWLGSGIASGGSTRYTGHVKVGDASGDILPLLGLPPGPGLLNPAGAEIHVVLRTHGQPIHGHLRAQSKTFAGGCDVNACEDLLAAVFRAP